MSGWPEHSGAAALVAPHECKLRCFGKKALTAFFPMRTFHYRKEERAMAKAAKKAAAKKPAKKAAAKKAKK